MTRMDKLVFLAVALVGIAVGLSAALALVEGKKATVLTPVVVCVCDDGKHMPTSTPVYDDEENVPVMEGYDPMGL